MQRESSPQQLQEQKQTCPICSNPFPSTDLIEINKHVDECLTKKMLLVDEDTTRAARPRHIQQHHNNNNSTNNVSTHVMMRAQPQSLLTKQTSPKLKCKNCEKYYIKERNNKRSCQYHPGR